MQSEGLPAFARLAADGADAADIAKEAAATWRDMHGILAAIIGETGVAAVFRRSLYLAQADFAWLAPVYKTSAPADLFASLQSELAKQSSLQALAGNGELLHHFITILNTLIGESLVQRLLGSAPDQPSGPDAAQERK
jgi:hypothetical protein